MMNRTGQDEEVEPKSQHARGSGPQEDSIKPTASAAKPATGPSGKKSAVSPRVYIHSPPPHAAFPKGPARCSFEVLGEPNTTVTLFVTVYRDAVIFEHKQISVALNSVGDGTSVFTTMVDDNEKYGMHARVETAAGELSSLRVVEYRGPEVIETKGGGV